MLNSTQQDTTKAAHYVEGKPMHYPWRLMIHISGEPGTAVGLELIDELVIGRADAAIDYEPGLDLIPYGAFDMGVSRQHAKLCVIEDSLFVQDLESTNGTRLNGLPLVPGKQYRVNEGDFIEFGNLRTVLNILRAAG
jgi:hypothetical protein